MRYFLARPVTVEEAYDSGSWTRPHELYPAHHEAWAGLEEKNQRFIPPVGSMTDTSQWVGGKVKFVWEGPKGETMVAMLAESLIFNKLEPCPNDR